MMTNYFKLFYSTKKNVGVRCFYTKAEAMAFLEWVKETDGLISMMLLPCKVNGRVGIVNGKIR